MGRRAEAGEGNELQGHARGGMGPALLSPTPVLGEAFWNFTFSSELA